MRMAVSQFGPVLLIELRLILGTVFLMPLVFLRGDFNALCQNAAQIVIVGIINAALPFTLLAYATLSVTAGFVAILNATTPLFGAIIAVLWLKERISIIRIIGLVIGFSGVVLLVWGKASFKPGGNGLAILAALTATLLYGIGSNYSKKKLFNVSPLIIACGSQLGGALFLLPPALLLLPAKMPSFSAIMAVVSLGVICTGIAYILFYQLVANAGAAKAMTVTFLIPVFAMVFGYLFLTETVTLNMMVGCAIILLGTGLATGLIRLDRIKK